MKKAFVKLTGFLIKLCRSFCKGVLSYNSVDKCCPLPYNLPSGSSAYLTARHEVPSCADGWVGGRFDGKKKSYWFL